MRMRSKKQGTLTVLAIMGIAALMTGCGASSNLAANGVTPLPTTNPGSGTGGGTSGSGSNFIPTEDFSFSLIGRGSTQVPQTATSPKPGCTNCGGIQTDTILEVQVTSGPAGALYVPSGDGFTSSFSATYGCVSYEVTVLGQTQSTGTLSVSGANNANCPNAPTSVVLDFSSRMSPGHGDVFIDVGSAEYDFYCEYFEEMYFGEYWTEWAPYAQNYWPGYCPLHTIYDNRGQKGGTAHTLSGSLAIETNGSSF